MDVEFVADVHRPAKGFRWLVGVAFRGILACARGAWAFVSRKQAEGLGTYAFFRATKISDARPGRPRWLYRSYPDDETVDG